MAEIFVYSVHCCVPSTWNDALHTIGAQSTPCSRVEREERFFSGCVVNPGREGVLAARVLRTKAKRAGVEASEKSAGK